MTENGGGRRFLPKDRWGALTFARLPACRTSRSWLGLLRLQLFQADAWQRVRFQWRLNCGEAYRKHVVRGLKRRLERRQLRFVDRRY